MPVCKSGIDQTGNKQSENLKVSFSAPSSEGTPFKCKAPPARLERATYGFEVRRSIH